MLRLPITDGHFDAPEYCAHHRGRNWVAIISGLATRPERKFLVHGRGAAYALGDLAMGDAVEVGADYISSGGIRYGDRCYYVVRAIQEETLVLEGYRTPGKALRAARRAHDHPEREARAWRERELEEEGTVAQYNGQKIADCPYEDGPDLRAHHWMRGYRRAAAAAAEAVF